MARLVSSPTKALAGPVTETEIIKDTDGPSFFKRFIVWFEHVRFDEDTIALRKVLRKKRKAKQIKMHKARSGLYDACLNDISKKLRVADVGDVISTLSIPDTREDKKIARRVAKRMKAIGFKNVYIGHSFTSLSRCLVVKGVV